jgi:MFS family permease
MLYADRTSVQLASGNFNTFIAGRTVSYIAVGWIDGTISSYASEVAPAALRGFFSGLLAPMANLASVWGAGMCQHYATETQKVGWMVPIGIQLIPVVMIAICWPFTVESPRWLLSHDRDDQALAALKKLRRKDDVDAGLCEVELEAIAYAIQYDKTHATARWRDLFTNTAYKQTIYTILFFFFYPSTGNAFYNAYGTTFFKSLGLGNAAFTYAILCQLLGAIGGTTGLLLTDRVGRRPLLIIGSALLVVFDGLAAGLASKSVRTTTDNNVVVACWMLMLWSAKLSWATHAYIVVPEMGGIRMRKKRESSSSTILAKQR